MLRDVSDRVQADVKNYELDTNLRNYNAGVDIRAQTHKLAVESEWSLIAEKLGPKLVTDVKEALARKAPELERQQADKAARLFFDWLARDSHDSALQAVWMAYSGPDIAAREEAGVQHLCIAFRLFYDQLPAQAEVGLTTAFIYGRAAAFVLQWLGELDGRNYPRFLRRWHRVTKPKTNSPSLASLPWPELEGMTGLEREKAALDLVYEAARTEFDFHYELFHFGQGILDEPLQACVADDDRSAIRDLLLLVKNGVRTRNSLNCIPRKALVADVPPRVVRREVWLNAGLSPACVNWFWGDAAKLPRWELASFAMCCLASSKRSVLAAAAAFAAGVGWNKTPILALSASPVVCTRDGNTGVATTAFVAAMKARASHAVFACLHIGNSQGGALEDDFLRTWRETAAELPGTDDDQTHCMLDKHEQAALLPILDRCKHLVTAAFELDPLCATAQKLLCFPTIDGSVDWTTSVLPGQFALSYCRSSILRRAGLTFPAIRKSFLLVQWKDKRCSEAVALTAGQTDTRVTLRHYLNTNAVAEELAKAIRFFQSLCQALLLQGREGAIAALDVNPQSVSVLHRTAMVTGISAVFGFSDPAAPSVQLAMPRFNPTPACLRELFVLHWALRRARSLVPPATWRARCLALMGLTTAVRHVVCVEAGLLHAYKAAARKAIGDVASGSLVLPPVEVV